MGKWAEVHCACPNRVPLSGSDSYFGKPHRKKRRLTKHEKAELEEWERTTKNTFECGHRGGSIIELSPGDIIYLGNLINMIFPQECATFEVFAKVGDWRCYEDELLLIQPDEAARWLMEIEEVQRAVQGCGTLASDKIKRLILEFYRGDLGSRLELERQLDEVAEKTNSGAVIQMKRNVQQLEKPDPESTVEKITQALEQAGRLCCASIETRNPIRLFW